VTVPRKAWTEQEIRALGTRTDLVTACQIVYGCGRNKAWEMYHAGELDFPALKVGRRVAVPVIPLLRLLDLERDPGPGGWTPPR
jgi:hypothetical protein